MKQALMLTILLMLFASGARAQQVSAECPDRPRDKDAARTIAKQWFSSGAEMFEQKKYAEATDAFLCSLRMVEHSATIYNASQAAIFSGDKKTALMLMKKYLVVAPDGEKAEEVKKVVAKLDLEIASESLQRETPPRVDEKVEEPEVSPENPPPPEPESEKSRLGPAPFIVAAGVSAALGVGTVVIDSKVGERFDTADKTGEKSDRDDAQSLQTVEKVFFGLTIAGVATTVVLLFLTDFKREEPSAEAALDVVTPVVFNGGGGLAVTGRF